MLDYALSWSIILVYKQNTYLFTCLLFSGRAVVCANMGLVGHSCLLKA